MMKHLSQQDPRWKDDVLGQGPLTIGKYGCLLTCMAMVANHYGFEETPASLNEKMVSVGGFQGSLVVTWMVPKVLPGFSREVYIGCRDDPAPLPKIDAYLSQGKPVVVEIDCSPDDGLQNHWVVLTRKTSNGDYVMFDPWPLEIRENETLGERYHHGSPGRIITHVMVFGFQAVVSNGTAVAPVDAENGEVVEAVMVRSGPDDHFPAIGVLYPGVRFPILERAADDEGFPWVSMVPGWWICASWRGKELVRLN